jgi:protein gp37
VGENSKIEWCHHTFNPWIGCQKVSPGCDHCYAETQNAHRKWNGGTWGPHAPRKRTSEANWKLPLRWARAAHEAFEDYQVGMLATRPTRPRVFCASLADIFDNQVPTEWRSDLFALIEGTPELDWLLLTKRPENIMEMLWPKWDASLPNNIWLGTTCEDQANADRRGRILRSIPARIRFLSCEPLLGPIKLDIETIQSLDLIISGGESGTGARPSHPNWHRSLRDQCATAGVFYHFKQWGEWRPHDNDWPRNGDRACVVYPDGRFVTRSLGDPCGEGEDMFVAGKKRAGRLLDGIEHNGMPA